MRPRGLIVCFIIVALWAPAAASAAFDFQPGAAGFDARLLGEGGQADTQAGSHPVALEVSANLVPGPESPGQPGVSFTDGDLRDLSIELPPGLIENPEALERCSQADFHTPRDSPWEASLSGESCPARSQVGLLEVRSSHSGGETRTFGLFNLVPPPGAP